MADVFMLTDAPIRVNARNEWLHGDDVIHPRVAKLFAQNVSMAEDGSYVVCLGRETQPIVVEDTPFWVTRMVVEPRAGQGAYEGLERVQLHLSDGSTERLDASTLMQSTEHTLYCRIERQGYLVPCRFTTQQYHTLAMYASAHGSGYALQVGQQAYTFAPYDRRPRPVQSA